MKRTIHPKGLLLSSFVLVFLMACSGNSGTVDAIDPISATDTTEATGGSESTVATDPGNSPPTIAPSAALPATGRILVSSTPIAGHEGRVLLIFGPNNASEICATIDADPWSLEAVALTERAADSDPCTGSTSTVIFEPGEHAVTASIFTPGSRTPVASTAALAVVVDGEARLEIDGTKLSADTSGDPGRIRVTVSEITGQAGKVLVVLGQNNAGSLCAMIDSDPWDLATPGVLRELPGGDGGPCGENTSEVFFPAGDTRVTAAILVPGSQTPDATIDLVATVDGDIKVAIDGSQLSG